MFSSSSVTSVTHWFSSFAVSYSLFWSEPFFCSVHRREYTRVISLNLALRVVKGIFWIRESVFSSGDPRPPKNTFPLFFGALRKIVSACARYSAQSFSNPWMSWWMCTAILCTYVKTLSSSWVYLSFILLHSICNLDLPSSVLLRYSAGEQSRLIWGHGLCS